MKRLFGMLIISVLILSQVGLSANIWQYSVTVELGEETTYSVRIMLVNYTENTFSLLIPGTPYDVKLYTDAVCYHEDTVWGEQINCGIPSRDKVTIDISYKEPNKITEKGSYYIFSDSLILPLDVTKFSYKVSLPEGNGLIMGDDAYSPEGALLLSDGRQSSVYWSLDSAKKGDKFDVSVAYENIGLFDPTLIFIVLGILIILVLIGIAYMKYVSKKKDVKIVIPILKPDEKLIFETVIKHDSGVKQKIVVQESGYSKAKVSKVLTNLQERGLLKLERTGRTNKIYYEEKFKNKL
ncbi:MAG: hypothetical protein KJ906_00780 [Nanoarchaeota archaeon]|nr:hypothetical protein [Nanoarchaeota archaeon]